jgi:glycosyltransferase involved in cell wall biosynthesis
MYYDLIIVTQSSGDLIQMTQNCINSALEDTKDINVIIIESGEPYRYENVNKIIEYNGVFNYNRALNIGLNHVKGDVHILANNDLIFKPGWSKIGELMQLNGYHSASAISGHQLNTPLKDVVYDGYYISLTLNGWCLFMDKYCHEQIGDLDETVSFWYSDDLYACQLKAAGIKHGLFCNCQVDHIASQTLIKQPSRIRRSLEIGEMHKFLLRKKYYAEREHYRKDDS